MSVVDDIKGRLDILDVVSRYVQLQRSGRSYKAICPFHTEKTPSFHVFPERQTWRCFGACADGGDAFSFVMRVENLDFSEAMRLLARQVGVDVAEAGRGKGRQEFLYGINEDAEEFFRRFLASDRRGSRARAYLQKRRLSEQTIEKFRLGLSPPDGESLRDYLTSKGYKVEGLALAGVVTQVQGTGYRDLFRGRLIFPIRDADGQLVGFGGRTLDDSQPKYLNSPRSPIFDKSHILYALHLAKDAIKDRGVVIVEGYMDAIMAHQHGFSNVVASMGTALTREQTSLARKVVGRPSPSQSREVVLALDPDAAGQEATLRSLESSWNVFQTTEVGRSGRATLYQRPEALSLKIAALPQGKDPDEIISESPDEWSRLVEEAVPLMDYLFAVLSSRLDMSIPEGKARLAELLFPLIAATPDPFQQDHYFQRLASHLGMSAATLQASLGRPRPYNKGRPSRSARGDRERSAQPAQQAGAGPFARLDHDPLEEHFLALMLGNPDIDLVEAFREDGGGNSPGGGIRMEYFRRVENREVFTNWMKCSTLESLRGRLDGEVREHLDQLLARPIPPGDRSQRQAELRYCVRRLEERYLRELNKEEEARLSQASPEERVEQEARLIQLNERLNLIFRQ